jgi:hypothetical protein
MEPWLASVSSKARFPLSVFPHFCQLTMDQQPRRPSSAPAILQGSVNYQPQTTDSNASTPDFLPREPVAAMPPSLHAWANTLQRVRSRLPSSMLLFLVTGLTLAVGHHAYYQKYDGQIVEDAEWPLRIGIALALLAQHSLVGAVQGAYYQYTWVCVCHSTNVAGADPS